MVGGGDGIITKGGGNGDLHGCTYDVGKTFGFLGRSASWGVFLSSVRILQGMEWTG